MQYNIDKDVHPLVGQVQPIKVLKMVDVATHDKQGDMWIVMQGKVYNVSKT